MAYLATINPAKSKLLIHDDGSADSTIINITVTWVKDQDPDLGPNDRYTVSRGAGSSGSVTPTDENPVDVEYSNIDTINKIATAMLTVTGKTYGLCIIAGSLKSNTTAGIATAPISIVPSKATLVYTSFSKLAMPVSATSGKPSENPDITSNLVVRAVDSMGVIIPDYPILFMVDNVRTPLETIIGVFYNGDTPLTLNYIQGEDATAGPRPASTTINTGGDGLATLSVVANNKTGYINCIALGDETPVGVPAFLYIYSSENGTEFFPLTQLSGDVSKYPDPTFDVAITNTNVQKNEFIGLFLNGKFQVQTPGTPFQSGRPVYVPASVNDLNVSDDPNKNQNIIFYCRTNAGDLFNSRQQQFRTTGTITPVGPRPNEPIILSPMVSPDGGVINIGSITAPDGSPIDFTAMMNVVGDVTILGNQTPKVILTQGMYIRVYAQFQGDYFKTDKFKVSITNYTYQLTDADLILPNLTVNISNADVFGFGTPKDQTKFSQYYMWYGYLNTDNPDEKPFASSPLVYGNLSTRNP